MSFSAIGAALGISETQARKAARRAFRKLQSNTPNTLAYLGALADDLAAERSARLGY
jgi:hypothetical protein